MVNYYKSRVNTECFPGFALGNHIFRGMGSETHTKRQATQHGCLPSAQLAGRWGQRNCNSVWWWKTYFVLGRQEQPKQNRNLLYRHEKSKEPTKKGPLQFVLFECPFTWVSTISRGRPSLVSLIGLLEVFCALWFSKYFNMDAYLWPDGDEFGKLFLPNQQPWFPATATRGIRNP